MNSEMNRQSSERERKEREKIEWESEQWQQINKKKERVCAKLKCVEYERKNAGKSIRFES